MNFTFCRKKALKLYMAATKWHELTNIASPECYTCMIECVSFWWFACDCVTCLNMQRTKIHSLDIHVCLQVCRTLGRKKKEKILIPLAYAMQSNSISCLRTEWKDAPMPTLSTLPSPLWRFPSVYFSVTPIRSFLSESRNRAEALSINSFIYSWRKLAVWVTLLHKLYRMFRKMVLKWNVNVLKCVCKRNETRHIPFFEIVSLVWPRIVSHRTECGTLLQMHCRCDVQLMH